MGSGGFFAIAVPPSGVVTFLFTDIEGSTNRRKRDAVAVPVALAAHNAVLGSAVDEQGQLQNAGERYRAAMILVCSMIAGSPFGSARNAVSRSA